MFSAVESPTTRMFNGPLPSKGMSGGTVGSSVGSVGDRGTVVRTSTLASGVVSTVGRKMTASPSVTMMDTTKAAPASDGCRSMRRSRIGISNSR